jgi:type I restriction enzyme, S subunit
MKNRYPLIPLSDVLKQDQEYIDSPEARPYLKLSVKLYGRGVELDTPTDGSTVKMSRHQIAKPGQVILSEIWAKKGAIGIVPQGGAGALVTSHFFLFDINRERALPEYMDWLFRANYFAEELDGQARGTTGYAAIRPKQFLTLRIPLPDIDEQQRIVARVEALVRRVEEAQSLREDVQKLVVALVTSLHLHLSGERTEVLSDILVIDEERVPTSPDEQYPQVGVRSFGKGLFPKAAVSGSETTYRFFHRLYSGAVVLSQVKGWEGAIAVCPKALSGYYASPEYRTFRCVPGKALPEYMAILVSVPWFWEKLQDVTRGVGARRERTRPEQFLKMELPMPTVEKQRYALQVLREIAELRQLQAQTEPELSALLPSILAKAVAGEL